LNLTAGVAPFGDECTGLSLGGTCHGMLYQIRAIDQELRVRTRTIFITGTDTGVGKTLLTGLLLAHLRKNGSHALAMKPFCSGGLADVKLLGALQEQELTAQEINPYYFSAPLAPAIAARKVKRKIRLEDVIERIEELRRRCALLLVEGVGGACAPLGKNYLVMNLIQALQCETIVVAQNKLGVIHSVLSTCYALRSVGISEVKIVLMEQRKKDRSAATNGQMIQEWLRPRVLESIPYLGTNASVAGGVKVHVKKLKKTLAKLLV
jgi:dethiobiotin synthetase